MNLRHFRYLFNRLNGFYLKEHVIMFRKPVEIWNETTGEGVEFKTVDEALEYVLDGETVRSIIERSETLHIPPINGGRGAGGDSGGGTFSFNHASGSGEGGNDKELLPAYANTKIKSKSLDGALAEFKRKHLDSDHEWKYEVDEQGYVHRYVEGAASSVGGRPATNVRNTMIIHNHPSGGAFSDSDLINTAMSRQRKGIIASGKNYDYKFQKGTHFKSTEFVKAVKTAKMKGKDYDDAADKWLKKNQKKFGYVYSRTKN